MKKDYQRPEIELISLVSEEEITDSLADGSMGLEDNILPKPQ